MRIPHRLLLLLPLLAIVAAPPANAGYDDALRAWKAGDRAAALAQFRELAGRGDAGAQEALAGIYLQGRGVEPDVRRAMGWLCRLAHHREGGGSVVRALWFLGTYFKSGGGFPGAEGRGDPSREDPVRAYFWFGLQARQKALYQQADGRSALLGKLAYEAEGRVLFERERKRIDQDIARWHPDRDAGSGEECLQLPAGLRP